MSEKTFAQEVPGVGGFIFRRRTFRDEGRIGGQFYEFTGGVEPPQGSWLDVVSRAYATLKVLTAKAPDGWDLDALDPGEEDDYRRLMEVFGALVAAETRFRGGNRASGQAAGQGAGGDGGALVPASIQPGGQ